MKIEFKIGYNKDHGPEPDAKNAFVFIDGTKHLCRYVECDVSSRTLYQAPVPQNAGAKMVMHGYCDQWHYDDSTDTIHLFDYEKQL